MQNFTEFTAELDTLTEEEDDKIFKNPNAKIKGASFKDASVAEHKKAIQYHKDEARRVSSSASISTGSRMSKTAFHNMRAKLHADHLKSIKESAICTHCQSDPCICDDSHGFVSEAAQGHTIEAHGIRGMKGTPWRKTFKSHEHLSDWADKNDSIEVHATRELDGVKKKTNEEAELDEVFADQGSGSTAKDNAEYMKRRKAAATAKHRVGVTVSEKDHPMVSKRLEKQQKFVKVSAGSKEEAVTKAKKFYSKQGYHVHGAEHHSMSEEVKSSSVPSFKQFIE